MLAVTAQRDHDDPLGSAVDELAAHLRRDAHELAGPDGLLLALDDQRQRPLEDEIDLLLALVAMDAPALARGASTSWFIPKLVTPSARRSETKRSSPSGSSFVREVPVSMSAI